VRLHFSHPFIRAVARDQQPDKDESKPRPPGVERHFAVSYCRLSQHGPHITTPVAGRLRKKAPKMIPRQRIFDWLSRPISSPSETTQVIPPTPGNAHPAQTDKDSFEEMRAMIAAMGGASTSRAAPAAPPRS
jgi:hypothetical protein